MAEYIEREAFMKKFCERCDEEMSDTPCEPTECFAMNVMKKFPSADVAPVRHGRWEWNKDHWECSRCRGNRFHDLVLGLDAAYCGRCGAKMDGGMPDGKTD